MPEALLSGKRVLVIEDEMLVLLSIEDMLADLGCTSIMVADDVNSALLLIADNDFDFATLDLNLNGALSYPVAAALTERHIPFAFSSGYGQKGVGADYSSCPVLTKPYGRRELSSVVEGLLPDRERPVPIARPLVEAEQGVRLGRPPAQVREIL